jgi:hypothetical protein
MSTDDFDIEGTRSPLPDSLGFNLGAGKDAPKQPAEPVKKIQRSFWIEENTWEAAAELPVSRTEIISKALLEAITSYKSELPQLRAEIKELDHIIECFQLQRSAKQQRVKELEEAEEETEKAVTKKETNRQQAATELIRLLEEHGKNMMQIQYKRLEELSGIKSKNIKQFLEKTRYFPTDEQINDFFGL